MAPGSFSARKFLLPVLFLLISFLAGCGGKQIVVSEPSEERDQQALIQQYLSAVENAKYPDPSGVRPLTPIKKGDKRFVWNDKGQILVANFTKKAYFPKDKFKRNSSFYLYGDTWFSTVPVMQKACSRFEKDKLLLRIQQMLGMPPKLPTPATETEGAVVVNDAFLELWIDPSDLFRPCPTMSIEADHCEPYSATLKKKPEITQSDPQPWQCNGLPEGSADAWLCNWWDGSYLKKGWINLFPWTALGYTYNWADMNNPQGAEEFVAYKGKRVVFESITPLEEYCK